MPANPSELYAASCNPPRKAKRARSESNSDLTSHSSSLALASQVPILPKRTPTSSKSAASKPVAIDTDNASYTGSDVVTPPRRGRKPAPLSRAARETQRKLNHSIIEKARRTKINDALATLRQLVPDDYGTRKQTEDADDDDAEYSNKKEKGKKVKKEEKEKEFKLEILIRTVSFMQDLLEKVAVLEKGECANCVAKEASEADGSKRKRHRANNEHDEPTAPPSPHPSARLPSISSWLPQSNIDPSLLPPTLAFFRQSTSHLPSPPVSTHFHPIVTTHLPPALTLDPPVQTSSSNYFHRTSESYVSTRTPEDESAASLLLQISTSPVTSATISSPRSFFPHAPPFSTSPPSLELSKQGPTADSVPYSGRRGALKAQTPSSLLGMKGTLDSNLS